MSVLDRWAGAKTGAGKRYEVRYREGGVQRKKRFATQQAAKVFDAERKLEPELRQAKIGRTLTVDQMMDLWLDTKGGLRPKTREAAALDRREVLLTFSGKRAAELTPSQIRIWVGRDRGYSLRNRSLMALSSAYALAVADGMLKASPTVGVPRPRHARPDRRFLSWPQLERMAAEAGEYGPMIYTMGLTGMRIGEAAGLRVGDVSLGRRRIRLQRQVTIVLGRPTAGPLKSGKPRDVALGRSLVEILSPLVEGRGADEPLFTSPDGMALDPHNFRERIFQPAAARAGLGQIERWEDDEGRTRKRYTGFRPHGLRHTAASLAIREGVNVIDLQHMLGHARPSITLDLYSHMFPDGLDAVAEALDRGRIKGASGDVKGANLALTHVNGEQETSRYAPSNGAESAA